MIPANPAPIRPPWLQLLLALGAVLVLALFVGCAPAPAQPARGSAVELAADRNARAIATTHASDAAVIDAAAKSAKAAALESAAQADPTPAKIEAAVAARVDAASAKAVADAMAKLASDASESAAQAEAAAHAERAAEATAARQEHLRRWCGYVGAAVALAGALAALLLGYLGRTGLAALVGTAGLATGILLPLYGAALPWIEAAAPWLLLTLVAAGIAVVVWACRHLADARTIIAAATHDDLPPRLRALAVRLGWALPAPGATP